MKKISKIKFIFKVNNGQAILYVTALNTLEIIIFTASQNSFILTNLAYHKISLNEFEYFSVLFTENSEKCNCCVGNSQICELLNHHSLKKSLFLNIKDRAS